MCSLSIHIIQNLLIPDSHVMNLEIRHQQLPLKSALLPENGIDLKIGFWHLKNVLDTDEY